MSQFLHVSSLAGCQVYRQPVDWCTSFLDGFGDQAIATSVENDFLEVMDASGNIGWIYPTFSCVTSFPCFFQASQSISLQSNVKLRDEPFETSNEVGAVNADEKLLVLAQSGAWIHVQCRKYNSDSFTVITGWTKAWSDKSRNLLFLPCLFSLFEKSHSLPADSRLRLRLNPSANAPEVITTTEQCFRSIAVKNNSWSLCLLKGSVDYGWMMIETNNKQQLLHVVKKISVKVHDGHLLIAADSNLFDDQFDVVVQQTDVRDVVPSSPLMKSTDLPVVPSPDDIVIRVKSLEHNNNNDDDEEEEEEKEKATIDSVPVKSTPVKPIAIPVKPIAPIVAAVPVVVSSSSSSSSSYDQDLETLLSTFDLTPPTTNHHFISLPVFRREMMINKNENDVEELLLNEIGRFNLILSNQSQAKFVKLNEFKALFKPAEVIDVVASVAVTERPRRKKSVQSATLPSPLKQQQPVVEQGEHKPQQQKKKAMIKSQTRRKNDDDDDDDQDAKKVKPATPKPRESISVRLDSIRATLDSVLPTVDVYEELQRFLHNQHLNGHFDMLKRQEITLEALKEMSLDELKEAGLTLGAAKRIEIALRKLK